jgi:hypothetical protein
MFSTSHLDLHNRNGSVLCHYFGCRKHKRLKNVHGGLFCHKHAENIAKLNNMKHSLDTKSEFEARLEEIRERKILCDGHVYFALMIEKKIEMLGSR